MSVALDVPATSCTPHAAQRTHRTSGEPQLRCRHTPHLNRLTVRPDYFAKDAAATGRCSSSYERSCARLKDARACTPPGQALQHIANIGHIAGAGNDADIQKYNTRAADNTRHMNIEYTCNRCSVRGAAAGGRHALQSAAAPRSCSASSHRWERCNAVDGFAAYL